MIKNNILLHRKRIIPLLNSALTEKHNGYNRDGYLFACVVAELYLGCVSDTMVRGGTNDGGVDIIAEKGDRRVAIQAKNYSDIMTKKNLRKNDMIDIFSKIKHTGEKKHGALINARLHATLIPYIFDNMNVIMNIDNMKNHSKFILM